MARKFYTSWSKVPGSSAQKKWAAIQASALKNDLTARDAFIALIVYDSEAFKIDPMTFSQTGDDHEVEILLRAKYFTTVRRLGRGMPNDIRQWTTFAEAVEDAKNDPRAIVYGVASSVNTTCLSRVHWDFYHLVVEAVARRAALAA